MPRVEDDELDYEAMEPDMDSDMDDDEGGRLYEPSGRFLPPPDPPPLPRQVELAPEPPPPPPIHPAYMDPPEPPGPPVAPPLAPPSTPPPPGYNWHFGSDEDSTVGIGDESAFILDDGKGKVLLMPVSGEHAGKLTDLPPGADVQAMLELLYGDERGERYAPAGVSPVQDRLKPRR